MALNACGYLETDNNPKEITVEVKEHVVKTEHVDKIEDPDVNPKLETTSEKVVKNTEHNEDSPREDPNPDPKLEETNACC